MYRNLAQLDSDTIGEPTLKAGVANFVADMSRAINSFPAKKEGGIINFFKNLFLSKKGLKAKTKKANLKALENFQDLNRSKHSTEPQVFDTDSLMESINRCPAFQKNPAIAAGIATQLVTLTTSEALDKGSQKALNEATTNILSGLLTKANLQDLNNHIDNFGRVNPDLVIAAANYARENLEYLRVMEPGTQKHMGIAMKKASNLILVPENKKSQLLAAKKEFMKVTIPSHYKELASKREEVLAPKSVEVVTAPSTPEASPNVSPTSKGYNKGFEK
jgi:hypothetical protein